MTKLTEDHFDDVFVYSTLNKLTGPATKNNIQNQMSRILIISFKF